MLVWWYSRLTIAAGFTKDSQKLVQHYRLKERYERSVETEAIVAAKYQWVTVGWCHAGQWGGENIIIIIIIAKIAVFSVAGYLIEERHRWPVIYCFPTMTTFQINSEFWRKGTCRWENRTSCLVGLKTHPTIVSRPGARTRDFPPP